MSQQFQTNPSHLSFVNPLDVFTGNWVLARRSISLPGLVVEHQVYLPNELEALLTQHVLGFHLNDGSLQEMTRIGERSYSGTFPKGSSFLIPADVPSFIAWKSADEGLAFVIEPAKLCQVASQDCEMDSSQVELLGTPFTHDAQIEAIASLFQQEINTGGLGGRLYAESLANVLMLHLLRHYCAFGPKLRQSNGRLSRHQLQQVKDYIHEHLDQTVHLVDLAKVAGISQYHFSRLFRQSLGITPHQYVLRQRVERGKLLLHRGERNIAAIAQTVGFADQSQFTRHFKRIVGITPSEALK